MTPEEFHKLPFAEARSKLLDEMNLAPPRVLQRITFPPQHRVSNGIWPLRFRSKGDPAPRVPQRS